MAVNYNATLKTNRMTLVLDLVGTKTVAASTGSFVAGQIVIGTASLSGATGVIATIPTKATPGSISGTPAVFTIDCTGGGLSATAGAGGPFTAAKAELRNGAGTMIVDGLTVGVGTGDVQLNSTSITTGQTVTITAAAITHS
jgi:hypothetical protein